MDIFGIFIRIFEEEKDAWITKMLLFLQFVTLEKLLFQQIWKSFDLLYITN